MVTLVDRTGQAVGITRSRGDEPEFIGKQGGQVVHAMKCLLGIDRRFNKMRDKMGSFATDMIGMLNIFHSGLENCWAEAQYVDALVEHFKKVDMLTAESKHRARAIDLMSSMPIELRKHLGLS
jgi:hypothetical protein